MNEDTDTSSNFIKPKKIRSIPLTMQSFFEEITRLNNRMDKIVDKSDNEDLRLKINLYKQHINIIKENSNGRFDKINKLQCQQKSLETKFNNQRRENKELKQCIRRMKNGQKESLENLVLKELSEWWNRMPDKQFQVLGEEIDRLESKLVQKGHTIESLQRIISKNGIDDSNCTSGEPLDDSVGLDECTQIEDKHTSNENRRRHEMLKQSEQEKTQLKKELKILKDQLIFVHGEKDMMEDTIRKLQHKNYRLRRSNPPCPPYDIT